MAKRETVLNSGRLLAIGDVHGCLKSLKKLLKQVDPKPEDTVIMLGDYVDRGPDSRGVIDYLLEWKWQASLICLKGNHELIMEHALRSEIHQDYWKEVGGQLTIDSYGGSLEQVPAEHRHFIERARFFHETDDYIFVHGGLHPDRPLLDQDQEEMCWLRFRDAKPHQSGKVMVCGHTVQKKGWPNDKGFGVCIDTAACRGGFLTCLDAERGRFWQANESGEHRTGKLPRKLRKKRRTETP
ncbi:MAG: metallophosphoesterase family protein [Akkermansiaceae bacterium]